MSKITQVNDHISIDQGQLIGKGSTGNVYRGQSQKYPDKKYAVKAIDLSEVTNEVTQYLLSCQIAALSELAKLNVRSIVKLEDIGFNNRYCFLAMELLQGGPLSDYIKLNPDGLEQEQIIDIFKQMFQGYRAIKGQNIVHRDIKPDNLIFRQKHQNSAQDIGRRNGICFIDFGYCTKQNVPNRPKAYYNVGSPKYMSPQAYRQNVYSQKSDIWALGIILYEMIHGNTIDSGMEMDEYMDFLRSNPIPIRRKVSQLLIQLIQGMLTFDYTKRMSCQAIGQLLNLVSNQKTYQHQQQIPPYLNQSINQSINQPINRQVNHSPHSNAFVIRNQPELIPQLNINPNRRQSQFYQSAIIPSDRSHPQNVFTTTNNTIIQLDPRRLQRNFSQQNKLQEYNHSPKKIIHVEHSSQRFTQNVIVKKLPQQNQILPNSRAIQFLQFRNSHQVQNQNQRIKLQKIIQEEYDQQNARFQQTNKQFFAVPEEILNNKRNILKFVQRNQISPQSPMQNPTFRIIDENNYPISPPSPVKNQFPAKSNEVFRSQIFPSQLQGSNRKSNVFYASQINQTPKNQLKVITSDRVIQNIELSPGNEPINKQLNKSYSTNIFERSSQKKENISIHPTFYQDSHYPNNNLSQTPPTPNFFRPIDRILNDKQISNQRAFLRNTMPAVYKSVMDNNQPQILPRTLQSNFIQNSQTQYKQHAPYFNYQSQNIQNQPGNMQPFNEDFSRKSDQNRPQRGESFKRIPQKTNNFQPLRRQEFQINPINQNPINQNPINQNPSIIPMGRIFNQQINEDRNRQLHNKFINFTHQRNVNQQIIHVNNQGPYIPQQNRIHEQEVRRNYMMAEDQGKQKRIPAFILNNQQRNIQQNIRQNIQQNVHQNIQQNISNGPAQQMRQPVMNVQVFHSVPPQQNQFSSIQSNFNHPPQDHQMIYSPNLNRQVRQTVPVYNQAIKVVHY